MADFESLTCSLEGWYGCELAELPAALQARVRNDFVLSAWHHFSPDQRRALAEQWDYKHDPALEDERHRIADLVEQLGDLETQIDQWASVSAPTASDLVAKESKLAALRRAEATVKMKLTEIERSSPPAVMRTARVDGSPALPLRYLAYPAALARLRQRLEATPEELAAWVYWGHSMGGLGAYVNANEIVPPPRFAFPTGDACRPGGDFDYVPHMMGCWFREDEIDSFQPADRYLGGRDLVKRWSTVAGLDPVAYVRAKISESRLEDHHPIYAATRASYPESDEYPPMEFGLFRLAEIEAIEAEDFGTQQDGGTAPEGVDERRARVRRRISEVRAAGTKAFLKLVAEEEGVSVSRIKQLVADKKGISQKALPADWIAPISTRDRASSTKPKCKP